MSRETGFIGCMYLLAILLVAVGASPALTDEPVLVWPAPGTPANSHTDKACNYIGFCAAEPLNACLSWDGNMCPLNALEPSGVKILQKRELGVCQIPEPPAQVPPNGCKDYSANTLACLYKAYYHKRTQVNQTFICEDFMCNNFQNSSNGPWCIWPGGQ